MTDRVFFRLPFNRLMVPGLIASAIGCALASIDPRRRRQGGISFGGGEVLILLSVICWSWYSTVAQRWCPDWSQVRITFVDDGDLGRRHDRALFGAGGRGRGRRSRRPGRSAPIEGFSLLWYIVTVMVLGVVLWNAGVRAVGVVTASLYINLTPVVAIAILVLMQGAQRDAACNSWAVPWCWPASSIRNGASCRRGGSWR